MSDENLQTDQVSISHGVAASERTKACAIEKKGWLQGGLAMVVCCAVSGLILGTVALFGISLGVLASGVFSVLALLACPVGMYLMMRMMSDRK